LDKKPLIVSNCKPQAEIVESFNCGMIYKNNKELKIAIVTLFCDPQLRKKMGDNGYQAILDHFNLTLVKKDLIGLYAELWHPCIKTEKNSPMDKARQKRFEKTLSFVRKHLKTDEVILDLGETNELSEFLRKEGYKNLINTTGEDLDVDFEIVTKFNTITAFEIFEHMFAPFNLLNSSRGRLIASVPLKLWFAAEYWNENDKHDCHYHEFSIRQFNHLLERTDWKIKDHQIWKSYNKSWGIRPLLRRIYPRFYIVYAEKQTLLPDTEARRDSSN
jgi:hypothetical protein